MVQELCTVIKQNLTSQQSSEATLLAKLTTISNQQDNLSKLLEQMKQQQQQHQQILQQRQSIVETGGIHHFDDAEDDDLDVLPGLLRDQPALATTAAASHGVLAAVSFQTAATRRNRAMGLDAFQVLRQTPRLPSLCNYFPESWKDLVNDWATNDLESFVKAKMQHWKAPALVQRFVKRHRAINVLRRFKDHIGDRRDDAAIAIILDRDRLQKEMSLSKHMTMLFKDDNTIIRRVRKTNNSTNINN